MSTLGNFLSVIPELILNDFKTILTEKLIIILHNLDINLQHNSIKIDILRNFQQTDLMHCRVLINYLIILHSAFFVSQFSHCAFLIRFVS